MMHLCFLIHTPQQVHSYTSFWSQSKSSTFTQSFSPFFYMASRIAEDAVELEAMRKEDSSWHPCQVSLSSTGVGLIVDFGSQYSEDMIVNHEEALTRLRIRSVPLQGDDCSSIEQGDHVLATHKSQFKSLFFDADVEKALRVRHSKRVHCRCTFMIKWLHPDFQGGTLTVPSSSIMKLSTKSINVHPTVAAFLKSIKKLSFSGASPFLTILEDMDCEMDLNRLVEKQIEGIGNLVDDTSKKEISQDNLSGITVDTNKQMQCKMVAASKVSISHVEVPRDQNHFKRSTRSSRKLQVEKEVKDPPSPASSVREAEVVSEIRSHLSPLASRAALASLVSKLPQQLEFSIYHEEERGFTCASDYTTHKHVSMNTFNGTKSFTSFIGSTISMKDKLSSGLGAASIPAVSESIEPTGRRASINTGLVEASSGILTKERENENKTSEVSNSSASLTCSITRRKLSQPINPTRITRSAVQKGTGVPNEDIQMKTSDEDKKLRTSTTTRSLTSSAVHKEKGNITMKVEQGLEENKSAQTTESDSSEGNVAVPTSDVSEKKCIVSKKKKPVSSPLDAEISFPIKESQKKQMSSAVETTQHTEGKVSGNGASSQGQKRKSTSSKKQDVRFSPRLRFLPRTRSQHKS